MELPVCQFRGEITDGRCGCRSPWFVGSPIVPTAFCQTCRYADQEENEELRTALATRGRPSQDRSKPCLWSGETVREEVTGPHGQIQHKAKVRLDKMCCGNAPEEHKVFLCENPARLNEEVTVKDCHSCEYHVSQDAEPILITNFQCPGDGVVMSAALESLHQQYPGKYRTSVQTIANEMWWHHPRVAPIPAERPREMRIENYSHFMNTCDRRPIHFMDCLTRRLGELLDIKLELSVARPYLHLSKEEKATRPIEEPYWIVNAGWKRDFPLKAWGHDRFQKVLDILQGKVRFVQIGEKNGNHHVHRKLNGVIDLVGKTSARDLMKLVYHSRGAIGGVTFLQHLAAAFEKSYVCINGGRESVSWVQYPTQTMMATFGMLDCCRTRACWKSHLSECAHPVFNGTESTGQCMGLIRAEHVADVIASYWDNS